MHQIAVRVLGDDVAASTVVVLVGRRQALEEAPGADVVPAGVERTSATSATFSITA